MAAPGTLTASRRIGRAAASSAAASRPFLGAATAAEAARRCDAPVAASVRAARSRRFYASSSSSPPSSWSSTAGGNDGGGGRPPPKINCVDGETGGGGGPVPLRMTPRGVAASKRRPVKSDDEASPSLSSSSSSSFSSPSSYGGHRCPTHLIKGGTPCDPPPPPFRLAEYGDGSLYTLVLLRHGESEWNAMNRYTGWCDVSLTKRGELEARAAGRLLRENGIEIDHAFTSVLKRASFTTNMALNMAGQHWVPVTKSWRLNERHYGALQGYIKDTAYRELGIDQELVMEMRRSYRTGPPRMDDDHPYWHGNDRRYKSMTPEQLERSRGESLEDTAHRIMPFFNSIVVPSLRAGNRCLIVSHANTIRTLIKQIDGISDEDIKGMSIPTGIPLLYRLDRNLRPVDPKMELEFKYMAEPRGYTWATSHAHGFHGVYLGDLERLQDIQRRRDETTREWQRIILRNLGRAAEEENHQIRTGSERGADDGDEGEGGIEDEEGEIEVDAAEERLGAPEKKGGGGDGVVETRQLWWKIHTKMQMEGFGNMLLLERMREHLEKLLSRKQRYMTLSNYEKVVDKIHLDAEGLVIEPFVALSDQENREKRARRWYEALAMDLEEECLIK